MSIAARVTTILVAVAFAVLAVQKLVGHAKMVEASRHLGVPMPGLKVIGALEIAGGLGLLGGLFCLPLGVAAAAGLVALMVGAVIFHLRASDPARAAVPAIAIGVVTLVAGILQVMST